MNTYRLRTDVLSNFHGSKSTPVVYASAKSQVHLIAKHDEVWIVADENGNRFSVQSKYLKEIKSTQY